MLLKQSCAISSDPTPNFQPVIDISDLVLTETSCGIVRDVQTARD